MSAEIAQLRESFEIKSAKIGVIGLGYVGLPLILTFVDKGFTTIGFDIDETKVTALENGQSYISHIPGEATTTAISEGQFLPTTDFSKIAGVDAILICVPTPLGENQEPDLSYVVSTGELIAPYMRAGQLVVLESTTYPGTSSEILKPILEKNGLKSGEDLFLAYSPEREDPGNPNFATASIPKVVGGDGPDASTLATALYDQIVVKTIPVTSMEVAEAVKLTENIFRSVNIAMVNELKVIYDKMGIDIWEVIEAAKSKPFGYMPFYPGPGLGGHCIPIDPFYLTYRAKQFGEDTRFIELAGEINTQMPAHVVGVLQAALKEKSGSDLKGASILLIGLAYKKNVNDTRESPAFMLMEIMESQGAEVAYFDPFVPILPKTREHASFAGRKSIPWSPENIAQYDAALICTDHDDINYEELVTHSKLVIDTRNATSSLQGHSDNIIKA
ncbi:MAG: nucleotide sugar dehydrogenase [Rhodospirillaceae bacterium]|jgi:UDP-N-acetyl-D-glucosamine dehydrogenase|nr:nucleotide sugar dehydrogenase [Rhodospirillaceae bacterium]MBT4589172.1 nucleotide sugar dehydrogenase [Rhodospirillaceae bacterium]MBT7266190.1 nucleotide sugar dehydrogenase [Rhodospirillaceae bacterium]